MDQVSLLSLTAALRSLSRSLRRQPMRSPSYQLPKLSALLFLTSSSTVSSRWLEMMSPAVFLQVGLASSSFMPSIFVYSFCSTSLTLVSSPPSFSSWAFMYSLMYFSPSLKDSSITKSSLSLRLLNSSVITLYILELKCSILMLMEEISLRTLLLRFSKHCADSILADSKLVLQDTNPAHTQFTPRPYFFYYRSSKLPKRLSFSLVDTFMLWVCRGTNV